MSKMGSVGDTIRTVLIHAPIPYYPFMFGLLLVLWGLWLGLPTDIYSIGHSYSWISQFLPKYYLVAAGIVSGATLMWGAATDHKKITRIGMLMSFYFWGFLCFSVILGSPGSPTVPLYAWLSLMSGLAWVNRKVRQNLLYNE